MAKREKRPGEGRPTKYDKKNNLQVEKLCKLGVTDEELADFLDISVSTLNTWKKSEPEFLASIKRGKNFADANVAQRLYERAMGFEHPEEEIKVVGKKIVRVKVRKIYPPDSTACIFFLKNRRPKEWRDKHEVVQGDVQITVVHES